MTATRLNWQKIRQYIWLIGGLLCLFFALIFWVMTDTKDLVTVENPIEENQVQIQPEKVAATAHLGSLMDEVRPLELTTRVITSGNHETEFRGTKFIQENQKNWTVELFRANKEDVIKSFLLKQPDRKNLIYFRLSGENQSEQYVVAYGVFNHEDAAKAQLSQLKIMLPASIQPKPIQFGQYIDLINDLGSEELQGNNKLYAVKLKAAALPILDETSIIPPKPTVKATNNDAVNATTQTTITRKDQQGNVVDVQKSHSALSVPDKVKENNATPEKKSTQREISDPFN
ncbi:hypothetical protein [Acinetobacter sp. ANC 4648]|uniref:hypothetical protein n=1 Tax=Acinetobacter sp. ANC 4648 TaxID=1977875 RepID=UPI000A34EB68|nr:hypothetical protein [Acinetobacter sp. ANC 4648]OTG85235.1 hypothetical protein B9T27_01515 [Acinetobacter sp. ANC 4648]